MPSENKTANIGLNQWQANEYPKREDFNADNLAIDEALGGKLSKTGDGKDVTVSFDEAATRTNVGTGEKLSVLLGKIKKWFSDLTDLAFGKCGFDANQALYTTEGGVVTADKLPIEAGGTNARTAEGARTNLSAAGLDSNGKVTPAQTSAAIITVSTDKTLVLTDAGTMQDVTVAATITIPLNSVIAFPVGTEIEIFKNTSSEVTIAVASGAYLYVPGETDAVTIDQKIGDQYSSVVLKQIQANYWSIQGALA